MNDGLGDLFGRGFIQIATIINCYHLVTTTITNQDEENQQTCTGNWIKSSVSLSKNKMKCRNHNLYES